MFSSVPSQQTWNPNHDPTGRNSPPPATHASPTRPGRLRGLSYLRNYTQNHLLSRESHSGSNNQGSSITRATTFPTASSQSASPTVTFHSRQQSIHGSPNARSSNPDSISTTSGWLPTVGGRSGVSRIATEARSTTTASSSAVLSNGRSASDITASMARTRSATVGSATGMPQLDTGGDARPRNESPGTSHGGTQGMAHQLPSIRFTAHQDPRAQRPSLVFTPMARILPTGKEIIKVGRYSERDTQPVQAPNVPSAAPVGFKSKVVSRRHCEFWCSGGRWYIKDVKSSSGTFLNHIRLSSPGTESRPFPINDGDIVQLGIDFKGGEEMIFRCVKIRVELNKGWQNGPSSFKYVDGGDTVSFTNTI
jgi:pSer/pThr/pTyr-binding forkhead associated (FHA) protein